MKGNSSLESRVCLLIMGLLFAILFAVGHVQLTKQRAALIEERTEKYESLSKVLGLAYAPLTNGRDASVYQEFTGRLTERDKDISYIMICDLRGRVLFADTRSFGSRQYQGFIGGRASKLSDFLRRLGSLDDPESMRITVPALVGPGERGTVTVEFGLRSMNASLNAMRAVLLCTFALAFLVGVLGAVLIPRTMAFPLKQLIAATRAIEGGNLSVSVPASQYGEIGELANSFDRMVVALKESQDKLIERANRDSLTGLYNHRYFQERLRSELARAKRYGRPLSVIMLDIDHFKHLNDTHGHLVGDAVLQDIAGLLVGGVRKDIDVVTRYGGEEFALILPETEAPEAKAVAERLRKGVERHISAGKGREPISVTISLGIAQYPTHSAEPEGLIMAADLAMYQSKSVSRNRATLFSSDVRASKSRDPYKLYLLLHATDMSTLEAMAAAVDAKGHRPPGFSKMVVAHSVAVAQEIGLSENEQNDVRIASLLHDIGKLGVSDAILNKREPLTDEEFAIIRSHPTLGCAVIQKSPHLKLMLPGILSHHEWWNGCGYPNGLKGEEIPLIARIIAVVDAYHAMMTERPHAPARTPEDARAEIQRCAGTQFDPKIVDIFLRILEREEARKDKAA